MIEILCGCGETMRFSDQLQGRAAKCPVCRTENTICIDPIRSIRVIDDLADVPPEDKQPRWYNSTPRMVVLGIATGIAGCVLLFWPWREPKPTVPPAVALDVPERVAAQQPSFAYVTNPTPQQVRQWRPYAKYVAEYALEGWWHGDAEVKDCEVTDLIADESPADPRKVSWLWTFSANVAVQYRPGEMRGESRYFHVEGLFRFVPPNNTQVLWHEVAVTSKPDAKVRKHTPDSSEWLPDFRKAVKEAKLDAKKKRRKPDRDHEIAAWFNLSAAELGEILAAPE